ncbi:Nuclear hormone receptor family member odr-7 [Aphelenchoides besseyi]|nr:Nuclear hormone receptor family member odr-7 [Aphelenchoides besseyi]KAI6219382.1 Nuclear hormone receptor family member odr-7 [Aphelenchoides besseyi]
MIEIARQRKTKMNAHDFTDFWPHPHSLFYNTAPVPPLNQLCPLPSNDTTSLDRESLAQIGGDIGNNTLIGDERLNHGNLTTGSAVDLHCNSQGVGSGTADQLFGLDHRQSTVDGLDLSSNRPPAFLPGMMHASMHPPSQFPAPGPSPLMMNITPGASAALLAAGFHSGFGGFPNPVAPFVSFGLHAAATSVAGHSNIPATSLQTPPAMFDLDQQRGVVDDSHATARPLRSGASSVSSERSLSETGGDGMPNLQRIDELAVAQAHNLHSNSIAIGDSSVLSTSLSDQTASAVAQLGRMNNNTIESIGASNSSSIPSSSTSFAAAMSVAAAAASNPLNFVLNNIAAHQQQIQQQNQPPSHILGQSTSHNLLLHAPPLLHRDDSTGSGQHSSSSHDSNKTRSTTAHIPIENRTEILGSSAPLCQICHSGPSNGLHFGAPRTCAACAAFFRRTISDQKKYVCKRPQRCTLRVNDSQGYRKICRNCRMKRCLEIGMMPEKVQHKRHRREVLGSDSPFTPRHLQVTKMERSASGDLVHSPAIGRGHVETPLNVGQSQMSLTAEELARQHYANQMAAVQNHHQQQLQDQLLHSGNPWALTTPMSLGNGMPRL